MVKTINKAVALLDFSIKDSEMPEGNCLEKIKIKAAIKNKAPTKRYKTVTLLRLKEAICSSVTLVEPNKATATITGPMVVPKEFTPPPKVMRAVPVAGSPKA